MRIMKHMLTLAAMAALSASAARGGTFELDTAHTTLGFGVKHLVVSTVHGKFNAFSGTIETGDDGLPTKLEAKIDVASIDTDNADRDKHLRSADFFDAESHPAITFESTKVEKSGDGVNVTGNLTIRGVTKEVVLPLTLNGPITDPWGNTRIGLEGQTTINRKDFGLVWNKTLDGGGVVVGDDVKINVSTEGILKK
jgi:polyisoprenoid-binding protein YceI